MKPIITFLVFLFPLLGKAQIEIKNDVIATENKIFQFKCDPSSTDHIRYNIYNSNNVPLKSYSCLFKEKKFNGRKVFEYLADSTLVNDGPYTEYYPNGNTKLSCTYKKGIKLNPVLKYSKEGLLLAKIFEDEDVTTTYSYNAKGQLTKKLKEGPQKNARSEILYYESGAKKSEISYINHRIDGFLRLYNPDSTVKRVELFKNGVSLNCVCYEKNVEIPCYPLFDSLYIGKPGFDIQKIISDLGDSLHRIAHEQDSLIKLSFEITPEDSIVKFSIDRCHNDSIKAYIRKWVATVSWPNERHANEPVLTQYSIIINPFKKGIYLTRLDGGLHEKNAAYAISNIPANEKMPEFPGGVENLYKYLSENLKYPADAVKNNISGRVYVQFTVCGDGSLCNYKVIRGVDSSVDAEALRVVTRMPKWKPGTQYGIPVSVWYTLPIHFSLDR
jgi:TonB family protein